MASTQLNLYIYWREWTTHPPRAIYETSIFYAFVPVLISLTLSPQTILNFTMEELEPGSDQVSDQNSVPKVDKPSNNKSKKPSVSFFGLFSAADKIDYLLMFIGSVGACIHGASLPVFLVLFGRLIDSLGHTASNPHRMSSQISQV